MARGSGAAITSQLVLFKANLLREIGGAAKEHVRASTRLASKSLEKSLNWEIEHVGRFVSKVKIGVPEYWARWLHDDTQAFNMPKGKFLVWYWNPDEDPRLKSYRPGWPVRAGDRPSLRSATSWEHVQQALEDGRAVMVGGKSSNTGKKFFTIPMPTFIANTGNKVVREAFHRFMRRQVVIRDRATLNLKI